MTKLRSWSNWNSDLKESPQSLEERNSSDILSYEEINKNSLFFQERIDATLEFTNNQKIWFDNIDEIIQLLGRYWLRLTWNHEIDISAQATRIKIMFIKWDFSILSEMFQKKVNELLDTHIDNEYELHNSLQELSDIVLLISRLINVSFACPLKRQKLKELYISIQSDFSKVERVFDNFESEGRDDLQSVVWEHLLNTTAILEFIEVMYFSVFETNSNQSKDEVEKIYNNYKEKLKSLKTLIDQKNEALPEVFCQLFNEKYQFISTYLDLLFSSFQEQTLLNTKCKLDRKQYDINEIENNKKLGLYCLFHSYLQVSWHHTPFMKEDWKNEIIEWSNIQDMVDNFWLLESDIDLSDLDSMNNDFNFTWTLPFLLSDFLSQLKSDNPRIFHLFRVIEAIVHFVDLKDEKQILSFQERIDDILTEKSIMWNNSYPHGSFQLFHPIVWIAINFKQMLKQLIVDVKTDHLTKLWNRKAVEEQLEKMIAYMSRHTENIENHKKWIMMFDLDDFKKINDEYGHDMWDFVLETLSNVLKQTMRKEDSIYRWWWEEFILLVECWDRDKALNCAEKLRNLISTEVTQRVSEKIEWFNRDITVSIWVHNIYQTVSQNNSTAQQEIFKKVDDASYISKQNGKNRVTFSDEINNSQTK